MNLPEEPGTPANGNFYAYLCLPIQIKYHTRTIKMRILQHVPVRHRLLPRAMMLLLAALLAVSASTERTTSAAPDAATISQFQVGF